MLLKVPGTKEGNKEHKEILYIQDAKERKEKLHAQDVTARSTQRHTYIQ